MQMHLQRVPIEKIRESKYRMRSTFKNIDKLAASIRTYGLIHPPVVMPSSDPAYDYEIVAGNRRLRALRHLGVETARFFVLEEQLSEFDAMLYTGIENIQRGYVGPLILGEWALTLLELENPETGKRFTIREIAARVGAEERLVHRWVEAGRTQRNLEEAAREVEDEAKRAEHV